VQTCPAWVLSSDSADTATRSARGNRVLDDERYVLCFGAEVRRPQRSAWSRQVHTAKYHVAQLLEKLDAVSRTDAVAHAARIGVLNL